MSSNLNYKQTSNVERRTWDREEYQKKARDRAAAHGEEQAKVGDKRALPSNDDEKEEFQPARKGAAGPEKSKRAFLQARRDKITDIDERVGSTEIVSADAVATTSAATSIKDGVVKKGVGWYCKVCDCFLKDSHGYLDHINGRKHQRNLGYSMRVEKSTKNDVVARLAQLKQEKQQQQQVEPETATTNYEDVVKAKDEEAAKRKEERARKRQERKQRLQQEEEEEEVEAEEIDPALAAMMGFEGFGGGNKNR